MSFSEWIISYTCRQPWYNYFIPPISLDIVHHEVFRAKLDKGDIKTTHQ